MKRATTCFLIFLSSLAATPANADGSLIRSYSNSVLLKNYALSQCVARAYKSQDVKEDGLSVADAYVQFGHVEIEAYGEVVALAEKWLEKKYESHHNKPLHLMKCIDLYHSQALQALVNKYTKTTTK